MAIDKSKIPSNNNIVDITTVDKDENLSIGKSKDDIFASSYYTTSIYDAKEFKRFVKKVESIVRQSQPYREYLSILKEDYQLDFCAVMGKVDDDMASIEFHHYPFSLYDIVTIVLKKRLNNKEKVSTLLVAQEVMDLHFQHMVGVVPLSITSHELAHQGDLFINLKQIFGNISKFVKSYLKDISLSDIKKFNKLVEMSTTDDSTDNGFLDIDIQTNSKLEPISLIDYSKSKKK